MVKKHLCSSCASGENETPADYYVTGKVIRDWRGDDDSPIWWPYRGYLCDEHLEMMCEDGAVLEIKRHLTETNPIH